MSDWACPLVCEVGLPWHIEKFTQITDRLARLSLIHAIRVFIKFTLAIKMPAPFFSATALHHDYQKAAKC